jgi:hypothetical protein
MSRVVIKLLPDKSGRIRIHWFVRDSAGPIQTPGRIVPTVHGPFPLGAAKGYIACNKALKDTQPQMVNGQVLPSVHSDDVRSATCPECLATQEAKDALAQLEEIYDTARHG